MALDRSQVGAEVRSLETSTVCANWLKYSDMAFTSPLGWGQAGAAWTSTAVEAPRRVARMVEAYIVFLVMFCLLL